MTEPRRPYYGWWMIAGLSLTEPVSWGVLIYAFSVFVVPMHAELGWAPAELNGGYTAGVAVSGLVAIPVGRWLQRHGARGLMTAGSVLTVLALLGWSQTRSLPVFYGCFLVAGLAMATTLYEPAFALTAAWFHRLRARAVLILTIAGGLGSTIFVPLTGALVSAQGWRNALLTLAGIVAVVTIPVHALVLRRWPADLGLHPDGASHADTAAPVSHPAGQRRCILRSSSFRWITLSMVTHETGKWAVSVTLVVYLTSRGYPLGLATALAGSVGGLQVIGRVLSTWLQPRIPQHRTAIILFTAQGIALPIPLLTSGHGSLATVTIGVLLVFFGLGFGLTDLMRGTLVADYYGSAAYASINGVLSTFVVAARTAGPLLAGLVATLAHATAPVLATAALLSLIGAYALHRAHHTRTGEDIPGLEEHRRQIMR
ncbi:MAG: MFS transporter [Pseudonocardiaceae bacterium]|nr:MFS transporter [Pseudonocardiaceae bacterium]